MAEQDPQSPRRLPGGALPPRYARPHAPEANGHAPAPPPAEELQRLDAEEEPESGRFRRVAEIVPDAAVATSGRPALVVIVATLVVIGVVVLAVVLYRMAPP